MLFLILPLIASSEVFAKPEHDFSCAALDFHDKEVLLTQFEQQTRLVGDFLAKSIPFAAYFFTKQDRDEKYG